METARDRYEKLLKLKGLKDSDVCRGAHVPSATLSDWKNGRYIPKADKMEKIADFLGVSFSYLVNGTEKAPTEVDAISSVYHSLTPSRQKVVDVLLEVLQQPELSNDGIGRVMSTLSQTSDLP